ncbi:MAG: hypothetical protein ACRC2K_13310 [Clostridium sp.]
MNEMSQLEGLISNLGLPIALVCALGYALYKVFTTLFQRFITTLDKLTETNEELVKTNATFVNKFNDVQQELKNINCKLEIIQSEVRRDENG